jgi:phage baseplate assembly protein gpV
VSELVRILTEMRQEIAELKRQAARDQIGTVVARDPEKGYRVQVGIDDDGRPKLTAWLPHPDRGGEFTTWRPLSVGQTVMVKTPHGDPRKAIIEPCGFNGQFVAPASSFDEVVIGDIGDSRITMKKDRIELRVGENTLVLTADDLKLATGRSSVTLRDKDIEVKARRTYHRGKIAAGLGYDSTEKVFPVKIGTQGGPAALAYSTTIAPEIPDDD